LHGASCALSGEIPAAQVYAFQQQLAGLTRGEGVFESAFERYRPVRGMIPMR
jgi:ribosomal protection tetracycline resistance protein